MYTANQERSGMKKGINDMDLERKIGDFVAEYTREFCRTHKIEQDTLSISKTLNISRTLASQHLNKMVKDGKLIKIVSRPVYYLDRKVIEESFRVRLETEMFYALDDLTELFDDRLMAQRGFMEAVGYDTTLRYLIAQCQAAVKYPPSGVPMLVYGEHGVGKTFFSELVYKYAKAESVIPPQAKCLWLNYSKVNENKFDDDRMLFGSRSVNMDKEIRRTKGLLEEAQDGFVVIENVEQMSAKCLEKVIAYIRTGAYTVRGENGYSYSKTRLIFTTCETPANAVENALLQVIPVVCKLPPLESRPVRDKEELIVRYLCDEGKRIGKRVQVSRRCFDFLLNTSFAYNISGLLGCLKTLCTNAFFTQQPEGSELNLFVYHLPDEILSKAQSGSKYEDGKEEMVDINFYKMSEPSDFTIRFFDGLIGIYNNYRANHMEQKEFIQKCVEGMNRYYDYIVFEKKYANERLQSMEKVMEGIFNTVSDMYDIYIPYNCIFVITRMVYSVIETSSEIREWNNEHREDVAAMLNCLTQYFPAEAGVTNEIMERVHSVLDVSVDNVNRIFLILNLQFYNRKMNAAGCTGLILEHGYSTASSISDVVNKLVGRHIFDAIDMPLEATVKEIIPVLRRYVKNRSASGNILLMVDMGSLESIAESFADLSNVRVGVINNVSTKVALAIGSKLMEGMEFEEIFRTVCEEMVCTYQIIDKTNKTNAVLFLTEGGRGLTERVIQLFRNSLTDKMDLTLLPYDYTHLLRNRDEDEIFHKYNVLFVVSTEKLELKKVPVVMLENIVAMEDSRIIKVISDYFPKEETEQFKRNLLKNFSFENVVRHLTILDADKLLDYVADALETLQQMLNIRLNDNTIVGLYIHICNMIECLVTNSYFRNEDVKKEVTDDEKQFIRVFHTAFGSVCRHYNIAVPQSEILYICTYVQQGIKEE